MISFSTFKEESMSRMIRSKDQWNRLINLYTQSGQIKVVNPYKVDGAKYLSDKKIGCIPKLETFE